MGLKRINLKQCLAFVGLMFLMGAARHEPQPPEATSHSHLTEPELTYARMDLPPQATNRDFLDKIILSLDPPGETPVASLTEATLNVQSDLPAGRFDELRPKPGDARKRALTVADRKLNYQLLSSKDFGLKLNLSPAYANPQSAIPNGLDPGFGISLKF